MNRVSLIAASIVLLMCATAGQSQTTAFTYQGRLTDGGTASNGTYEMQFKLYDTVGVGTGNQIGSTISLPAVPVTDGVFTVLMNWPPSAFPGADRFLEIAIRPVGNGDPHTVLSPRRIFTSSPYAIRALSAASADNATNATQLGGVPAAQYATTASGSFIQNTNAQQANANFNISGEGKAGSLSAGTVNAEEYRLGNNRVMGAHFTNFVIGVNGPIPSNLAAGNTLVGYSTGKALWDTANGNSFFGTYAGTSVIDSYDSSFFGNGSGRLHKFSSNNSYFGAGTGFNNLDGVDNSFFGFSAGGNNTASRNSFFGSQAGGTNGTATDNAYFGYKAGNLSTGASNSMFGSNAGVADTTGFANSFFGKDAGLGNTIGFDNVFVGRTAGSANVSGSDNTIIGTNANVGSAGLSFATAVGAQATVATSNTIVLGRSNGSDAVQVPGTLAFGTLAATGVTQLCRNVLNQISNCSSSLRYKTNIRPFAGGLSVLNQLRPITFDWKQGGMSDLGFGAEEIAAIEPLLVTRNDKGEVEGVKYDRISAVLVNAVKEQQLQLQLQHEVALKLQSQLTQQQSEIDHLKKLLRRQPHSSMTRKRRA